MSTAETGTIRTNVPARLDRLPWARWHWLIVIGLGTVWILDGLEVTIVGNLSGQLSKPGSGIDISQSQITGLAAALYVAGACTGALFFGWLTDRFGRKKLFMITLGVYLTATALTALSFEAWWFFLFRFLTGFGIGGEYAAINSAIDELIPSRHRGRIDIVINGTYWAGAAFGALLTVPLITQLPTELGWRMAFGVGVVLGLVILLVRRNVPESPRWLFIHGRERQAENLVGGIEREVDGRPASGSTSPTSTSPSTSGNRSASARSRGRWCAVTRSGRCWASRSSSARRSSTTRSRSVSRRSCRRSSTCRPVTRGTTSPSSRPATCSGRCCWGRCSTRSAASR